ncbi:MAG TPA: pentapeptide repeat-containing protein [Aliidongia sp.]|nr:pentapeptide repeat-containing protein [Aliidongia sp.]
MGDGTLPEHSDALEQTNLKFDFASWPGSKDFAGSVLRNASFKGADLTHADFSGAVLDDADFTGADLHHACFKKAELPRARFNGADLRNVDFCGSDLTFADFTDAKLDGCRFRACNLSGATIAIETVTSSLLATASELSATASRTLLTLLGFCLYAWITLATTSDAALVANSSTSPLPVLSVELPIVGFFWVAPLMLYGMFLYLQLSLQRLWETLAELPAYLPDGKTADRTADTWFFSGMLQANFSRLRDCRPGATRVENGLSRILIWGVTPLTIAAVWLRYLPRHDWAGTSFLVLLFGLAITTAGICYTRAAMTLGVDQREQRFMLRDLSSHLPCALSTVALIFLSIGVLTPEPASSFLSSCSRLSTEILDAVGFRSAARLTDARLSAERDTPAASDEPNGIPAALASFTGPALKNADLRDMQGAHLFAPQSDLKGALLRNARLWAADLRLARLDEVQADGVNLAQAKLSYANLLGAQFPAASLWHVVADHVCGMGTVFAGAHLEGADLSGSTLIGADFTAAAVKDMKLAGANISQAKFTGATDVTEAMVSTACGTDVEGLPAGVAQPPRCAALPDWCNILLTR